jgi:hypothetical protein
MNGADLGVGLALARRHGVLRLPLRLLLLLLRGAQNVFIN